MSLLREWDEASKARRKEILKWFDFRFSRACDYGELEHECGSDVSLLLPRILAWLDKVVAKARKSTSTAMRSAVNVIDALLGSVKVFFHPTNILVYLHEFMQADGLRILLQTLESRAPLVNDPHRCIIYGIVLQICQRGDQFKEAISGLRGEIALVRGAIASSNGANLQSRVWRLCRMTLLQQMVGNISCITATHEAILFMINHEATPVRVLGLQITRELLNQSSFYFDSCYQKSKQDDYVGLSVALLQADSIPIQHEALELVHLLLLVPVLRLPLCSLLARWIHDAALAPDILDAAYEASRHTQEYEMYIHIRSPFVRSAQALTSLMHSVPRIIPLLVQKFEILIPIAFILTIERPKSLRWHASLVALHFIFKHYRSAAIHHLCQLFAGNCQELDSLPLHITPDVLAEALLRDDTHRRSLVLQFYRNGWVRVFPDECSKERQSEDDEELAVIEHTIEEAVAVILPTRQLELPPNDFGSEDDIQMEADFSVEAEERISQKLERHFHTFRPFNGNIAS